MQASLKIGMTFILALAISVPCFGHGLEIGAKAPSFTAVDLEGQEVTLDSFDSAEVIVIVFTCNECPVATAYEDRFQQFFSDYSDKEVVLLAINNSQRESIEAMKRRVQEKGLNYPYVYDGSGKSARDFGAQVTPHCFVLDRDRTLIYKGAFDDNWNEAPTVSYIGHVVDALLAGETPEHHETQAVGCAIKVRR